MKELSPQIINDAAQLLQNGGLVAFPTETVYGLGANAFDPAAVRRVFSVKKRPSDHPLIVHLHSLENLDFWAKNISQAGWRLAEQFWPGPLTLTLNRNHAPLAVTGGQETIGIRIPDHPVALALLKAFGGGIAAPSANRFGRISPTRAKHVRDELQGRIDLILDGGSCREGVESTILSLADDQPRLLRPGSISLSALQEALGADIVTPTAVDDIRVPGMLKSHYSPVTRFEVWPTDELMQRGDELINTGIRIAIIFIGSDKDVGMTENSALSPFLMPNNPAQYAQKLYALLHMLDGNGFGALLAESPPETEAWLAVNDRLKRARCNQ